MHFDVPDHLGRAPDRRSSRSRALEHADLVCIGEGEDAASSSSPTASTGRGLLHDVPGLWMRRDGDDRYANAAAPLSSSTQIAIPDFEPARTVHINDDRIRRNVYPHNLGRQYPIMTQRGCPFSCYFCIESVYQDMCGKKDSLRRRIGRRRHRGAGARRSGSLDISQVMFYDDVFTVNPRWLREFAPALQGGGRPAVLVLHLPDDDPTATTSCC